jgi:CBS domain containing-hemolysin-like protein
MTDPSRSSRFIRAIGMLKSRLGLRGQDSSLRQSIEDVIEEHEADFDDPQGNDINPSQREMLRNLLDYGDLRVDDVAVPRADIIAFDVDKSFDDLVQLFAEAAHSRLPVYRDSLDGILGMVHMKDVYRFLADPALPRPNVEQLLRSVLFVPASMRVLDLLARMRAGRMHMAIVVDEYGGTDGLATIEDLVEEIIGDIEDEHDDAASAQLRVLPEGVYDVDARLPLTELEEVLGLDFLDDQADQALDTVGGLVFFLAGRVPTNGENVVHKPSQVRFEVVNADPRRILRLHVHPPQSAAPSAESASHL